MERVTLVEADTTEKFYFKPFFRKLIVQYFQKQLIKMNFSITATHVSLLLKV